MTTEKEEVILFYIESLHMYIQRSIPPFKEVIFVNYGLIKIKGKSVYSISAYKTHKYLQIKSRISFSGKNVSHSFNTECSMRQIIYQICFIAENEHEK